MVLFWKQSSSDDGMFWTNDADFTHLYDALRLSVLFYSDMILRMKRV